MLYCEVMTMKTSKPLSLLLSLLTALAVLSGSIAAPLLCRPFYYAHIDALGLVEYTGLTREQITEAFDQVMDYCLGQRPDFAAGVLQPPGRYPRTIDNFHTNITAQKWSAPEETGETSYGVQMQEISIGRCPDQQEHSGQALRSLTGR